LRKSFKIVIKYPVNFFILNIAYALGKLSLNTKIIFKIFQSIKNSLIILLMQGDLDEKLAALTLLFYYAFDDVINEILRENQNIRLSLEQIVLENDLVNTNFAILLKHMLNLEEDVSNYENERIARALTSGGNQQKNDEKKKPVDSNKSILISCCIYDELVCSKLKQDLNKRGMSAELIKRISENRTLYKNDDLDVIKCSIENCSIFVACISIDFNENIFSNYETFYAYKLKKKIIPFFYEEFLVDNTCYHLRNAYKLNPKMFKVKNQNIEEVISKFIDDNFRTKLPCKEKNKGLFKACFA
jgi:hypothetical protein